MATKQSACPGCARIVEIIEAVETRCMAVDGPVTGTLKEMTPLELREIYRIAREGGAI